MSWDDAHRYNQALRDVEEALEIIPDVEYAWRPEYGPIFGSPDRLLLALRSRWQTTVRTLARAGAIYRPDEELRGLEVAAA